MYATQNAQAGCAVCLPQMPDETCGGSAGATIGQRRAAATFSYMRCITGCLALSEEVCHIPECKDAQLVAEEPSRVLLGLYAVRAIDGLERDRARVGAVDPP